MISSLALSSGLNVTVARAGERPVATLAGPVDIACLGPLLDVLAKLQERHPSAVFDLSGLRLVEDARPPVLAASSA